MCFALTTKACAQAKRSLPSKLQAESIIMKTSDLSLEILGRAEFWRQLNPHLHITDQPFIVNETAYELAPETQTRVRQQMIEDGYFLTPPIIKDDETALLCNLALRLHQRGVMPLFAAMYDEFWQTTHRLRKLLTPILGPDYRLIPDFWIWHVAADDNVCGWSPHRDGAFIDGNIRADGTPTLCTAWIALSDVETSNSCIYILPRKYDALFQDFVRKKFGQPGIPNAEQTPLPLSRVRALPAKAGSIIGWDQNLLHWGSGSSQWATGPRISIGVYYQASDAQITGRPFDSSQRIHIDYDNPACRLTLQDRLTILANIMDTYSPKLDKGEVVEPHYGPLFQSFRDKWKWPARYPSV